MLDDAATDKGCHPDEQKLLSSRIMWPKYKVGRRKCTFGAPSTTLLKQFEMRKGEAEVAAF
jgi:hypothetical protein